jgi:hypothetical protein
MKSFPRLAFFVLVALVPLLSGCASNKGTPIPGTSLPPTNPDSVQILYATPDRNFRVVGTVDISRGVGNLESRKSVERRFQVLAANLGAQAVIIDTMPKSTFTGMNTIKGTARAIVWDNRKPE